MKSRDNPLKHQKFKDAPQDLLLFEKRFLDQLNLMSEKYVQKLGIVRFNPYNDTGGNQSFAIAFLDRKGDGLVLSSLHGRAGTRVYSKPVVKGEGTEFTLSDEEKLAIKRAMEE